MESNCFGKWLQSETFLVLQGEHRSPQLANSHPAYFLGSVPKLKELTLNKLNSSTRKWCQLVDLCVVSGLALEHIMNLWAELLVRRSKHNVSLESQAGDKNWRQWRENQHSKCFPKHPNCYSRWVWEWHILAYRMSWVCASMTPIARFTPNMFPLSVSTLKRHIWVKQLFWRWNWRKWFFYMLNCITKQGIMTRGVLWGWS